MDSKKCRKCDRFVYSPNSKECDYCLGKIVLPGETRGLYTEPPKGEKSFCTECGEPNYWNKPSCEHCGGITRKIGGGSISSSISVPTTSKSADTKAPDDSGNNLTQQLSALTSAQNQTNSILQALAGFFLYSIHTTLIFVFLIINALKNDSTGGLWVSWLIYFGAMGFFVYRAKEQIGV